MVKFICNRLARDKTPEDDHKVGILTQYKILEKSALEKALRLKLIEESDEVNEANNRDELIVELADVLEVIDGLCKANEILIEEILEVKKLIHEQRGGYEKGIFVETIEMAEDNVWVKYFTKSPNKYKLT